MAYFDDLRTVSTSAGAWALATLPDVSGIGLRSVNTAYRVSMTVAWLDCCGGQDVEGAGHANLN